ncbi:MAG: hypothetical protein JWO38_5574 [Gemmataceae bacterium]|nr:hypothetical protein [Gemmataceae bacterium]
MGSIKSSVAAVVNWAARPFGMAVVPAWRWREFHAIPDQTFPFAGREFLYFLHHYNCGRHPVTGTERMVELALADRWLSRASPTEVVEVGAVTPYYWPGRVGRVVDPTDPHPQVSDRTSILDLDMTGRAVLCLSTLEHVGSGEYGLPPDPAALRRAVDKLFAEARAFLVTIPAGYTPHADQMAFEAPLPADVAARFLVRSPSPPYWREVSDPTAARRPYGPHVRAPGDPLGASGLVVWERGGYLGGAEAGPG